MFAIGKLGDNLVPNVAIEQVDRYKLIVIKSLVVPKA
jgi:hypothetical protein